MDEVFTRSDAGIEPKFHIEPGKRDPDTGPGIPPWWRGKMLHLMHVSECLRLEPHVQHVAQPLNLILEVPGPILERAHGTSEVLMWSIGVRTFLGGPLVDSKARSLSPRIISPPKWGVLRE